MLAKSLKNEGKYECKDETKEEEEEKDNKKDALLCDKWKQHHVQRKFIKELKFDNIKENAENCILLANPEIDKLTLRYFLDYLLN